jgi:1-acyl-sn-glycerol-3-phosphate acyltransferase
MIAAPHTSNLDFLYSRSAFYLLGLPVKFAIKKEFMESVLGPLLKSMGAIGIDRSKGSQGKRNSYVDQMVQYLNEHDHMFIMIAPEGTRKLVKKWKSGFYYIAKDAGVPLICGYLDYKKRHAGIGPIMEVTDDSQSDMERVKAFYRTITPKYPELFNA